MSSSVPQVRYLANDWDRIKAAYYALTADAGMTDSRRKHALSLIGPNSPAEKQLPGGVTVGEVRAAAGLRD